MFHDTSRWTRFKPDHAAVYVSTAGADWFVPNAAADTLLQHVATKRDNDLAPHERAFLCRLPDPPAEEYLGRKGMLKLEHIRELWFHVTNRCNMACSHCLFASSPGEHEELEAERVLELAGEAWHNGCRLFALTGGEPLVHRDITRIVRGLLDLKGSHVVLLTNGLLAGRLSREFSEDLDRLHLQISIDGLEQEHDRLRGNGAFRRLDEVLRDLHEQQVPCTLSMCVTRQNMDQMEDVVRYGADHGIRNLHFMWYFVRGRGTGEQFAPPGELFERLRQAAATADQLGVNIDNIESMKTRVFAPAGTIHDGSTAGWESMAVGPDGMLYPTAALVGIAELATPLDRGLETAWKESAVLDRIRSASIAQDPSPMRHIIGGGDLDHSYIAGKTFTGRDPYRKLYESVALWLITRSLPTQTRAVKPEIRLQMGELLESCGAHGSIALTHSNCLLSTATNESLTSIQEFYSSAAGDRNEEILNPVGYDTTLVSHIPEAYRFRGYGCGSPVMDAGIREGEDIVDLGCGSGVECFIAARMTGKNGSVRGIDMLDPMLDLAEKALPDVVRSLGYDNVTFRKSMLEDLPLENGSADVVLSNCVMNLSLDKRRAWSEILRILRPGGRIVISDVVCETEPDAALRNDETLRGECIAGALTETHLMALLEETGFTAISLIKRFPYRTVRGHRFYSLTFRALKPQANGKVTAMYRGPLPWIVTADSTTLMRGQAATIERQLAEELGDTLFLLDDNGYVTNIEAENCCSCAAEPEERKSAPAPGKEDTPEHHRSGCLVCGSPLLYEDGETLRICHYCGKTFSAQAICREGHYVCDSCHADDAVDVIRHICLTTGETDMLKLFEHIRSHPAINMHGPEYHAMVPGIILATYRNLGGDIIDMNIESGINRGTSITGGACGFMGICGAAAGAGTAFSIMLKANPLKAEERKTAQQVTADILRRIAQLSAARCCQRDCWIALKTSAELSSRLLDIPLKAEHTIICTQKKLNNECPGDLCPVF
ncbi:MAG: methyltransferase domain-containing protein [Prosthecochloris sp.]|nr:methyltransferase domain-containing protein [Prosthecochloris sp.]